MIAEKIGEDIGKGDNKAGRPGLDALLAERQVEIVTFRDWQKIEAAEVQRARNGSPREKFVAVEEMIRAKGRSEEHTSELKSLMRHSYAVFCLTKQTHT